MARDYICLYHSYLDAIQALGDAERGRLLTAMLEYSITGEAPQLNGNERFIFPLIKSQIDRDRDRYETKCAKAAESGRQRTLANASDCQRTLANAGKEKDKEKEKGKDKGKSKDKGKDDTLTGNSAQDAQESLLDDYPFSLELRSAVEDWLAYKHELRQDYKPTGLKSMLTQIHKSAAQYGDAAVAETIRESMANRYQGIVFDQLRRNTQRASTPSSNVFAELLRKGEFE